MRSATLFFLNKVIDAVGWICAAALLLMIINVFVDVFVRYILVDVLKSFDLYLWYDTYLSWLGGIGMQELEWHWFSILFLLGLSYTLRENGHVRVDVFYDKFPRKVQAIINISGALIFTVPFCIVMVYYTWDFFENSYFDEDNRGDPGSLPRLWPVKLILPLAFSLLIISALIIIIDESFVFTNNNKHSKKTLS